MVNSVSERPAFGGEFICGDTVFWVGHRAYVELAHILSRGDVFMFRGVATDGEIVDRWINGGERLGPFVPDPSKVDRLTFTESSIIDDEISQAFKADSFPLVVCDSPDHGLLIMALADDV